MVSLRLSSKFLTQWRSLAAARSSLYALAGVITVPLFLPSPDRLCFCQPGVIWQMNTMTYKEYEARIEYSEGDGCFIGHIILEYPTLTTAHNTASLDHLCYTAIMRVQNPHDHFFRNSFGRIEIARNYVEEYLPGAVHERPFSLSLFSIRA